MSNIQEQVLETATSLTQSFAPVKSICAVLNGFHNYAHDLTRSVEANHFCAHVRPNLRQCLIYDSPNDPKARLIGVEYMIPIEDFEKLPEEEKKYWHSHFYEVKGGLLVLPKPAWVPSSAWDAAETKEMSELVNWMGKTYHFWQVDRGDPLPYGEPQLMMSMTKEAQVNQEQLQKRDKEFGVDHEHKKMLRKDIVCPPAPTGCDAFSDENKKKEE
jgi:hypothetical protein